MMEWGYRRAPELPFLLVFLARSLPNCLIPSGRTDCDGLRGKCLVSVNYSPVTGWTVFDPNTSGNGIVQTDKMRRDAL